MEVADDAAAQARSYATSAGERTDSDQLTDAIGEGLAGVAFAILELAAAIREAAGTSATAPD